MQVSEIDMRAASTRVSQSLAVAGHSSEPATRTAAVHASANTAAPAAGSAGDITSNDFLTLLVTEMKNQDPTQPTDPNAYIQQLVGVNSLQQLISINQELGTATAGSTGSSSGSAVPAAAVAHSAAPPAAASV